MLNVPTYKRDVFLISIECVLGVQYFFFFIFLYAQYSVAAHSECVWLCYVFPIVILFYYNNNDDNNITKNKANLYEAEEEEEKNWIQKAIVQKFKWRNKKVRKKRNFNKKVK